jgi:hypothetical protein
MKYAPLMLLISLLCPGPAWAGGPVVALVENVTGASAGVEFMDYVEAGKIMHLDPQDSIVLSYLYSCVRETIEGGIVTVGREQSDVQLGKVERAPTKCDAGRMQLTAELASQSAGTVFRSLASKRDEPRSPPAPQFTLYGSAPMVQVRDGGGAIEITRIDGDGEHYQFTIGTPQSLRSSFYDFAAAGTQLSPGGVYQATLAGQSLTFKIDPSAKPGKSPIVGRLLRFDRAL